MSHDHDEKDVKGETLSPAVIKAIANMGEAFFYQDSADKRAAARAALVKMIQADTARIVAEAVGDVPGHLVRIARQLEALKRPCGMDPESITAIHNSALMGCSYALRTLSEGLLARSTQPDAATVECGCCATGCPAGQCRHAKENP